MYNDIVELVSFIDDGVDEYGDPKKLEVKRPVFCNVRSVGMSEFYQAQTLFYNPEIKFVLADYLDFECEEYADHEGYRYKVLRTYRNGKELEITCYGGVRQ
ncbi:MAG: hypothetical protein KBT03_03765 [Bacteroidales bacterium]|nr:hypothetical protein [Candidatus Scybalousia scybalohippi]